MRKRSADAAECAFPVIRPEHLDGRDHGRHSHHDAVGHREDAAQPEVPGGAGEGFTEEPGAGKAGEP